MKEEGMISEEGLGVGDIGSGAGDVAYGVGDITEGIGGDVNESGDEDVAQRERQGIDLLKCVCMFEIL